MENLNDKGFPKMTPISQKNQIIPDPFSDHRGSKKIIDIVNFNLETYL